MEEWFPKHSLEDRSRENYTLYLESLIVPYFTESRMIDIMPNHIRDFVADMAAKGVPTSSIEYCLVILGAIFTAALKEGIVFIHPCRGVSAPPRAKKVRQIITPEEFDDFYAQLAEERWQLLVETDIETGLRWGELTELRPKDFNFVTRRITVKRVAEELMKRFHPEGGRFKVRDYPKDKEHRQVPVSRELCRKIQKYININGIGEDDLVFEMPSVEERRAARQPLRAAPDPDTLGWTEPNERGRTYRHGTMSAYSARKCRCEHCRASYASYRASRRNAGKDSPRRIRAVDTDGHIPRRWFRDNIWLPARLVARLQEGVTPHSMRHAHASWALAGGADIERVKERLGHGSILTTQKYLHKLSGIASAGRETAGQQATGLPERRYARPDASRVTWEDPASIPPDARFARQRACIKRESQIRSDEGIRGVRGRARSPGGGFSGFQYLTVPLPTSSRRNRPWPRRHRPASLPDATSHPTRSWPSSKASDSVMPRRLAQATGRHQPGSTRQRSRSA